MSVTVFSVVVGMWGTNVITLRLCWVAAQDPTQLLGDKVSHVKGKKLVAILVAVESNFKKLFLEVIPT